MTAALEALSLEVRLGEARVLDGLSIEAHAGEVLGVFGPSGAGKSTLFRALAGDEPILAGSVRAFGVDVTREPMWRRARRGLGYVPQTPSLLADLSIEENLRTFAALGATFSIDRARELCADLGLPGRPAVRAGKLSGGERRKLEVVRALAASPKALLLDEPFAALDPESRSALGRVLTTLARGGAAIVLADHDVREVLELCDRAALLLAGKIAFIGTPEAFAAEPAVMAHYVALV